MPGAPTIVIPDTPAPADRDALVKALIAYNDKAGGPTAYQSFAILLKDDAGAVTGGLWGRMAYQWLYIELFVLPDDQRHQGLGSQLLAQAEQQARASGCIGVWLDTLSFQAPAFYRRHGYSEFGRIDDFPPGASRHFFIKRLDGTT